MSSTTATVQDPSPDRGELVRRFLSQYGVVIALVVLLIAAYIWTPSFYTESTLRNTARQAAIIGIVTVGQFLLLMIRGIDLSIPAVIGFTAVLIADSGPGSVQGLVAAIAIALGVGFVNYYLVVHRKVPAFVATFGMLIALEGARLAYTRGSASGTVGQTFVDIGRASLFGLTLSTWSWILLIIAVAFFLHRTRTGRRMIIVGSNPTMAEHSGINTSRYFLAAFVASSLLAVAAGVFLAGSTGYVDRFMGRGTDLDSITAALLGGARFAGGQGSIVGAAVASLLLASLLTVIVLLGWSPQLQLIAKGLVLIAAIALQSSVRTGAR
jgi:ribose transport system permease protein